MIVNEIRVGNIIGLQDGSLFRVTEEVVRASEFWEKLPDLFHAVPLTEELLLKMGFEEESTLVFSLRALHELVIRKREDQFEIIFYGKPVVCKPFSVHRLQNLIYELADEELTIVEERDELREAVEMVADSILYRYIPSDVSQTDLTFELSIEGDAFTVRYGKDQEGYWVFQSYDKVPAD